MRWIALTLLAGCLCPDGGGLGPDGTCEGGFSEDNFISEFGELLCVKSNECLSAEGLDNIDCLSTSGTSDIVCDFNKESAASCIDQLEVAQCQGAVLATPAVCGQVYTNCR